MSTILCYDTILSTYCSNYINRLYNYQNNIVFENKPDTLVKKIHIILKKPRQYCFDANNIFISKKMTYQKKRLDNNVVDKCQTWEQRKVVNM